MLSGLKPSGTSNTPISVARRSVLWVATSLLLGLSFYGFTSNSLFNQVVWIDNGFARFLRLAFAFAIVGAIFFHVGQKYFRILFSVAAVMTVWALCGAGSVAGALLCFLSFLCLGDLIIGVDRDRSAISYDAGIAIAVGASAFIGLVEYTARSKVHYPLVYLIVLLAPIVGNLRGLRYWFEAVKRQAQEPPLRSRFEFTLEVAAWFFIFFYILLVVKPEVSSDGLAQHLTVPSLMATGHRFNFDFHQFIWAFAPMGSDWLYTLGYGVGGEFAARFINFGFLCGITFLLFGLVKEISASRLIAWLCSLLWLSTPLVDLVTGSLFSENLVAFLSVASFAAICAFRRTASGRFLSAFCILFGGALASKLGSIAFFVPLLPCAIVVSVKSRMAVPKVRTHSQRILRTVLLIGIVLCIAGPPYVRAWQKTGNPVFPFMNGLFKSPYFHQGPIQYRYHGTVDPRTIYKMTYEIGYLEAVKGSFGFEYLLLIPLAALAFRRSWPFAARLSVIVSLGFLFVSLSFIAYSRYLYAGLPVVIAGSAALFEDLRRGDKWLYRSLFSLGLFCILLNAYFLPASGWYQRDGFFDPLHEEEEERSYAIAYAPVRALITYLNDKDPGSTVVFLTEPAIAGLKGFPLTYNWYNTNFFRQIKECDNAAQVAAQMARYNAKYFIGHLIVSDTPALQDFVNDYLVPEYTVNTAVLYRWRILPVNCLGVQAACEIRVPVGLTATSSGRAKPGNTMSAAPNPIIVRNGSGLGQTTIYWKSTAAARVDIRVSRPDGTLLGAGGATGVAPTGNWVRNGTRFYMQDHDAPDPTAEDATLGIVTVTVREQK